MSEIAKRDSVVSRSSADCPPPIRGSGRTQWMIDHLCDAVAAGQPLSRVFGHTLHFAIRHLRPRIIQGLEERGLVIDRSSRDRIEVEGRVILFFSTQMSEDRMRGCQGFGDFVDHYADGEP